MTYRDDAAAARDRATDAERERDRHAADHARLAAELARAREPVRGRTFVLGASAVLAAAALGFGMGRFTATKAVEDARDEPVEVPLPVIRGFMVASGPLVGQWSLNATVCHPRPDGSLVLSMLNAGGNVLTIGKTVSLGIDDHEYPLDHAQCAKLLAFEVTHTPAGLDGHVDLDCDFDGNRVVGRFDFAHCR